MTDGSTLIYGFAEGSQEMKDLLSGKEAGLAAMSNLKLPVPRASSLSPRFASFLLEVTQVLCNAFHKTIGRLLSSM